MRPRRPDAECSNSLRARCPLLSHLGQSRDSDPTDSDPTDSDPTDSDPTDSDPTDSDPTDSDPTDSDPKRGGHQVIPI